MTDQRMPGEKGTWLLEKAAKIRPRIVRILATAFSDMDAAIAASTPGPSTNTSPSPGSAAG